MAKGYWIAHVTVTDPEAYARYFGADAEAFEKYGARFLVRGGAFEQVEGAGYERQIVIEFESYQQAIDCYQSEEYQTAKQFRVGAADFNLVIVEGTV